VDEERANKIIKGLFLDGKRQSHNKGQILFWPKDEPNGVCWIEKGFVKSYVITNTGQINLLHILDAKDIFPLVWALDVTRNSIEVFFETMSKVILWKISKQLLLQQLSNNSLLAKALLQYCIRDMQANSGRLENVELRTAKEQVAYRILFLAERYGRRRGDSIILTLPYSHQDTADSIGLTRETVNRETSKLIKKNYIQVKRSELIIKSYEGLKRILPTQG
jgi:CRP/FNR family transcriptional regulator